MVKAEWAVFLMLGSQEIDIGNFGGSANCVGAGLRRRTLEGRVLRDPAGAGAAQERHEPSFRFFFKQMLFGGRPERSLFKHAALHKHMHVEAF